MPWLSTPICRRFTHSETLVDDAADIEAGLRLSVNLRGAGADEVIGYRAQHHTNVIDVDRVGHYDVLDFWEPRSSSAAEAILIQTGPVLISSLARDGAYPSSVAAEMVPFDPVVGDFRVHYAGFFDPGFGGAQAGGRARAVLEVRSFEVPFTLEHGQTIGRLVFERLTEVPDLLYGGGIGSNYQSQGLRPEQAFPAGLRSDADGEAVVRSAAVEVICLGAAETSEGRSWQGRSAAPSRRSSGRAVSEGSGHLPALAIDVPMLVNLSFSEVFREPRPVMMPTPTMGAMRPYSMAVAPDSSWMKRRK